MKLGNDIIEPTDEEVATFTAEHPDLCPRCGWALSSHGRSQYGLDCNGSQSPAAKAGYLPMQVAMRRVKAARDARIADLAKELAPFKIMSFMHQYGPKFDGLVICTADELAHKAYAWMEKNFDRPTDIGADSQGDEPSRL